MNSIDFTISINLSLDLNENKANISIKNVNLNPAIVSLPMRLPIQEQQVIAGGRKKTIHDIALETAKRFVSETGAIEFTAANLYNLALEDYPQLKRNSFSAHVIAAAPDHPSHGHYANRKDYLIYLGDGKYRLKENHGQQRETVSIRPSDLVRQYAKKQYIDTTRDEGKDKVSIRAGNVHNELGFSQRLPLVCAALRSKKFLELCNIDLVKVIGPKNSTTTIFMYKI